LESRMVLLFDRAIRAIRRGATFETIRRCFVKVAVRVTELKSRIKIAFPAAYPHAQVLIALDLPPHRARAMSPRGHGAA